MLGASSVFELLAADYRRQILLTLCDSEHIEVPDAILMRGARHGQSPAMATSGTTADSTVTIELYHTHLPKLAQAGLIEWDRDAGVVSRGPEFEQIRPMICLLAENEECVPGDLV
ncbi:DUF7344 domain-containing protein [Haloarcula pellucida]|uniref:DUF7344 domain-containing protein n=1 Tax=Haloarcula pellucida TaxID=1427151 RepID=A0A830GLX4_9EURY|nr:hypothetical protein GCM10009030_26670 [Halomicroarcula pellucida]